MPKSNFPSVLVLHTSPTTFGPPWTEGLKNNLFAWMKVLKGTEFTVITNQDFRTPKNVDLILIPSQVHSVWEKVVFTWRISLKARSLLQTKPYDYVLFNINSYNIVIPLVMLWNVPRTKKLLLLGSERLITSLEEFKVDLGRPPVFLKRLIFGQFGAVITVSHKLTKQLKAEKLVPGSKIFHLPGLSLVQVHPGRQKKRLAQSPFPADSFVILYLGNFHHTRGILVLLEAFKDVVKKIPQARLLLCWNRIGNKQVVEDYILQHQLEDFIRIETEVDLADVFSYSDCFVLPMLSQRNVLEYPLTILESLYYGVPVITTPLESFKELIQNGKNGVFFNGSVSSLSRALVRQAKTQVTPLYRQQLKKSIEKHYVGKTEQLERFLEQI